MKRMNFIAALIIVSVFSNSMCLAGPTFSFQGVTSNSLGDVAIGQAQMTVEVTDGGSGKALFTFKNIGPDACRIAEVYFFDGVLLDIAELIDDQAEVNFEEGSSAANGFYNSVIKPLVVSYTNVGDADEESGAINGVDPGESLGVLFNLHAGKTFSDVVAGLDNELIIIGIHVQGFASGGSEKFINNGQVIVPAPGAFILGGIGISCIGWMQRKRSL